MKAGPAPTFVVLHEFPASATGACYGLPQPRYLPKSRYPLQRERLGLQEVLLGHHRLVPPLQFDLLLFPPLAFPILAVSHAKSVRFPACFRESAPPLPGTMMADARSSLERRQHARHH